MGTRDPLFDPEPSCAGLQGSLRYPINFIWLPEPYQDVPTWIAAMGKAKNTTEGE